MPKESVLKFTTPELKTFIFMDNDDYVSENGSNSTNLRMQLQLKENDDDTVVETLTAFIEGKQVPYKLQVSMSASFFLRDVDEANKTSFLRINAPSLIFSYIRPLVSQLTSISKYETVTLPFFDFTNSPLDPQSISQE